jgi:hypothetical protein
VRSLAWVADSSPGSREAEGEGGEDFYIARSGKHADLLVSPRGREEMNVEKLRRSLRWRLKQWSLGAKGPKKGVKAARRLS